MKKIFAIALALVMVLSMASAFAASDCFVWGKDWSCTVKDNTPWCGKGSVEIVPLVKVNTACGWEFQVNECAGAVRSEEVYYAVKLTVDAYPDKDWWTEANLFIDDEAFGWDRTNDNGLDFVYGPDANGIAWNLLADDEVAGKIDMTAKKEVVYYASFKTNANGVQEFTGWVDLANTDKEYKADADALGNGDKSLNLKDVAYRQPVPVEDLKCGETYEAYEICATLSSFYDGASKVAYNKLGGYYYAFSRYPAFDDADEVEDENDGYTGTLTVWAQDEDDETMDSTKAENMVVFTVADGAIVNANWNFPELKDNEKFYVKVMEDLGFTACGTAPCVTYMNVLNNFGWNDAFKSCTDWSDKAASVVDAECVVAIPKTGDASVLAWLF